MASNEEEKSEDSEPLVIPDYGAISDGGSVTTTKSTSRYDKHCLYGKCGGKFVEGSHWARHLKTHKVSGAPDSSMFSLCSGIGCGACIKCKYRATLPLYYTPLYHYSAPLYHYSAPLYHYLNLTIVIVKSTVVSKEKGPSPTKAYYKCTVCTESKRYDTIAQTKPVICKACINKREGKVRGKKRPHTAAV